MLVSALSFPFFGPSIYQVDSPTHLVLTPFGTEADSRRAFPFVTQLNAHANPSSGMALFR